MIFFIIFLTAKKVDNFGLNLKIKPVMEHNRPLYCKIRFRILPIILNGISLRFSDFFMFPSGPKIREIRFRRFSPFLWLYCSVRLGQKKKISGVIFFYFIL